MKIAKIFHEGKTCYGELRDGVIYPISGELFGPFTVASVGVPLEQAKLLAPVDPSKIVAIGKNYMDHINEMAAMAAPDLPEEPEVFLKPPSSILNPGENIVYPIGAQRVDYEAEIAVVIKKRARYVKKEQAMDYVFGFTLLNDVSRRDKAKTTTQWVNGKGYDTFCPVGPYITTGIDLDNITIRSHLNGELRQNSTVESMIFSIPEIIEFVTNRMTLLPGDVIATGTPSGVAPMQVGDVITISSDQLGELKNQVVLEALR